MTHPNIHVLLLFGECYVKLGTSEFQPFTAGFITPKQFLPHLVQKDQMWWWSLYTVEKLRDFREDCIHNHAILAHGSSEIPCHSLLLTTRSRNKSFGMPCKMADQKSFQFRWGLRSEETTVKRTELYPMSQYCSFVSLCVLSLVVSPFGVLVSLKKRLFKTPSEVHYIVYFFSL